MSESETRGRIALRDSTAPHLAAPNRLRLLRPLSGTLGRRYGPLWIVRARWIDIEIDDLDATLRPGVTGACDPRPVLQLNVADLRHPETAPLAAARQSGAASAAELIGQRLLLPL